MGDLYPLDFDGVLCDSCGESSLSAVKAAKVRWPDLFTGVDSTTEDWIVAQMYTVIRLPCICPTRPTTGSSSSRVVNPRVDPDPVELVGKG
ncbi:unnamed protein product [Linum trigynum]|uniref:Uncharacterized protein n=1 Tax=Linum trigynum TaxID=586398 RepID=A0AAV2FI11_9ROSI